MGITVRGIPELQRNLLAFPKLLMMECIAVALRRAADVFVAVVRARCPMGKGEFDAESGEFADGFAHLVEAVEAKVIIDPRGHGRARIGFGKLGYRALFVEFGHRMVGHRNQGRVADLRSLGKDVPAHPFMRPAFEAGAEAALEAFTQAVEEYMSSGSVNG